MLMSLFVLPALAGEPDSARRPSDVLVSNYASVSSLSYRLPTSVTLTREWARPETSVSASVFGAYLPDVGLFGPISGGGVGVGFHYFPGETERTAEFSVGLDMGAGVTRSDEDGELSFWPGVLPTAFIGYRRQPRSAGSPLVRIGLEMSMHSLVGLTISVGRAR